MKCPFCDIELKQIKSIMKCFAPKRDHEFAWCNETHVYYIIYFDKEITNYTNQHTTLFSRASKAVKLPLIEIKDPTKENIFKLLKKAETYQKFK